MTQNIRGYKLYNYTIKKDIFCKFFEVEIKYFFI